MAVLYIRSGIVKLYKLNYLIMKFISIPKNGSSWRGRLPYSFTTEGDEPQDVTVEILNYDTGSVLGTMRLYGVVNGEVDIAPYIRPYVSMRFVETSRLAEFSTSLSAIKAMVRIGGVLSEPRVFFRSEFDSSVVGPLSDRVSNPTIIQGESIRMTIFAQVRADVAVSFVGKNGSSYKQEILTRGMPVELVVNTNSVGSIERVNINIRCDNSNIFVLSYTVMQHMGTSQRIVWYNKRGGVESYLFDHAKRLSYDVDRGGRALCDAKCLNIDGRVRYRLCSGYEQQADMERVAQLMLSPIVCRGCGSECREVEVESREITFDDKGVLRSITLDLSEKWEGGESLW